jgi:pantoate--beta-alanine ligase
MKTTGSIKELRTLLKAKSGKTIALVPTMGYLHSGHMKLVDEAKRHAEISVVSIFVNPLQFGPNEDFDQYPRDLKRDLELCRRQGVDYVFHPDVKEMYPKDLELDLQLKHMSGVLDGVDRPGHFEGVVTVVNKLFNIIKPDYAVFGEKDRQQLMIIERLIEDFNHDIKILPVHTEREEDGLAQSSRNVNLTAPERREAPSIYAGLEYAEELIEAGVTEAREVEAAVKKYIAERVSGEVVQLNIYSYPDLKVVEKVTEKVVIFAAVRFSQTRLIDNKLLTV